MTSGILKVDGRCFTPYFMISLHSYQPPFVYLGICDQDQYIPDPPHICQHLETRALTGREPKSFCPIWHDTEKSLRRIVPERPG